MRKKNVPVISIVLFALAGLLLIYSVWVAALSVNFLTPQFEMGLTFEEYTLEIVTFYMTNIAQTVLFAIVFFALGWILYIVTPEKYKTPKTYKQPKKSRDESSEEYEIN